MITQVEVTNYMLAMQAAAPSNFSTLASAYTGLAPSVILERQHPDFTQVERISNPSFYHGSDAALNPSTGLIVRFRNWNGVLYVDKLVGGTWTYAVLTQATNARPQSSVRCWFDATANVFRYWYINTSDELWSGTINASATSSLGSGNVSNLVQDFAVVPTTGSPWPIYYTMTNASPVGTTIMYNDAANNFTAILSWWTPLDSFDVVDISELGSLSNDVRHVLVLSTYGANQYVFKEYSGTTPQKEAQWPGGIISFLVTPPGYNSRGTNFNLGGPYPIHTFDQFTTNSFNIRSYIRAQVIPSEFDPFNFQDTVLVLCGGSDGEINNWTDANFYSSLYVYASRDGKHWTQDRQLNIKSVSVIGEWINMKLLATGQSNTTGGGLWLITQNATATSNGCADYFNALVGTTSLNVSSRILDLQMDWTEAKSLSLTLDNRDNYFNGTFVEDGSAICLRMGYVYQGVIYPVGIFEVDSASFQRQLPVQQVQISARDHIAWLTDRSSCQDSRPFDNTIIGFDNFADISGQPNTGLAHTAAIAGSVKTASAKLVIMPSFKETICFSTHKASMASGQVSAWFTIPNPVTYSPNVGGANGPVVSSSTAPTYAGVVFRALDKDNFWFVRYNYWNSTLEVGVRAAGADTIKNSATYPSGFNTSVMSGSYCGVLVDFNLYGFVVYANASPSSYFQYGGTYQYPLAVGTAGLFQGYTGTVACGFSDETSSTVEYNPTVLIGLGI